MPLDAREIFFGIYSYGVVWGLDDRDRYAMLQEPKLLELLSLFQTGRWELVEAFERRSGSSVW